MQAFLTQAKHYLGIAFLLVILYFIASALIDQAHSKGLIGNQVSVSAPTPSNASTQALETVSNALKDKALADALSGTAASLSASQSTIARALQEATGASAQMAGALAAGLSKPAPVKEVISVGTTAKSSLVGPPKAESDDQIQADMKSVLASTTVKTQVNTNVSVSWADKPMSPIFAAYTSSGDTGAGYTLHRAPLVSLDALLLIPTGTLKGLTLGLGLEHIFKGTSAGLGVEAGFNTSTHRQQFGVYAAIHS